MGELRATLLEGESKDKNPAMLVVLLLKQVGEALKPVLCVAQFLAGDFSRPVVQAGET